MANPTAGVSSPSSPWTAEIVRRPLAATAQTYYPGEMIGLNASGYATKMDDTQALKFEGINAGPRITVESGDSAGDKKIDCQKPRWFSKKIASAAAGDEGKLVFALYSDEVSYSPGSYSNLVGRVLRVVSATEVEIEPIGYGDKGELLTVSLLYDANSVDRTFFVADRAYKVLDIRGRPDVAGTDGGAVTAVIKKAASATAIASGTALHSGTYNLKGTAATNQVLTLSTTATDLDIAAGTAIGIDYTGTLTSAVGVITVTLLQVG